MQTRKSVLAVFWCVALMSVLNGCINLEDAKITGASPDPGVVITAKPGDTLEFEVTGPADGQYVYLGSSTINGHTPYVYANYRWGVSWVDDSLKYYIYPFNSKDESTHADLGVGTKSLTYTVPDGLPYNKVWISCRYGDTFGDNFDSRIWTIRIDQGTQPTFSGTYYIEDQTDVDMLKGYTAISGDLVVRNDALTNLVGLENLKTIGGSLIIHEQSLANLQGLENLTSVGAITISYNSELTSLGMDALARVNGAMRIFGNAGLCNSLAEDLWDQVAARDGVEAALGSYADTTASFIGNNLDCTP